LIERQSAINRNLKASQAGKAGGKGRKKKDSPVDTASTKLKTERVRTELSKRAKVSERKVKKARKLRLKNRLIKKLVNRFHRLPNKPQR
jgi:hypothetical protein